MTKLSVIRFIGLFLFLITISSPSNAGANSDNMHSPKTQLTIVVTLAALFAFGFQMASSSDEDISGWPYHYRERMEKILSLTSEIEKWNPASGPLYDASNDFQTHRWVQIATNFNKKKDELINDSYDDYPKGEDAHPITKITLPAIDKLEKVIIKKGGPTKLYKISESAKKWAKEIEEISKQIEAWDGDKPLSAEQIKIAKAAIDENEREQWMDYGNKRDEIGFHYSIVYDALTNLAKVVEKKGGKSILEPVPQLDFVLQIVLDEIKEATKLVNEFDPKTRIWTARYDWIWRAISLRDRESWAADFFKTFEEHKDRFYKELDKLALAFSKKVDLLTPGDDLFKFHNDEEEELMKQEVTVDEIHAIGIEQKTWEIQYVSGNEPKHKIKNGFIWGRNKKDDTPYCRLYQVTLLQQYAGGGQYEETIAKYFNSWPRPCPEGKSKQSSKTKPVKSKSKSSK